MSKLPGAAGGGARGCQALLVRAGTRRCSLMWMPSGGRPRADSQLDTAVCGIFAS